MRRFELLPSSRYAGLILGVHVAAGACFLTVLTGPAGIALAILILTLGAASAWNRALLRGHRSPRAIEMEASGAAAVVLANGERIGVRAVRGIGVTRHWVALAPLSLAGPSVMVTAGMLGSAGARLLRLWALWGAIPGMASGQRLT